MSTTSKNNETDGDIAKSVFISQSNNVFSNLALEDWMYRNLNFTQHHVMLLWRNDPCVVIGRHQNPWLEANIQVLAERGVVLSRRNSGGGTVYHDKGNLNVTFFAPRERYNRKQNLQLIAKSLEREWNLNPQINKREDIILDSNYKISGTASKLGRPNSYHHCTLLVNVNKDRLSEALHKNGDKGIITNATQSIPSPTVNLSEVHSGVSMERLMTALGWEYLRTAPVSQQDAGWPFVSKQRGFQLINPTDEWFPGLEKIKEEFESWDWVYGRTPSFKVRQMLNIGNSQLTFVVEVDKGVVLDVSLELPPGTSWGGDSGSSTDNQVKVVSSVRGQRYTEDLLKVLERAVRQQAPGFLAHLHRNASPLSAAASAR
ncbi:hypothetical protein AAG570_003593 [Ranatra chinensis]|uniref:BPL/LPL catalytic domain-containing protein n=1 Tax=Ranatra chinensis TaxID=642074 RepID=A0ABD0YM58_9HEMI